MLRDLFRLLKGSQDDAKESQKEHSFDFLRLPLELQLSVVRRCGRSDVATLGLSPVG